MIRVFISAASAEWKLAKHYADHLVATGRVELTSRWFDDAASWTGRDAFVSRERQHVVSEDNFRAVDRADVVWCLWPNELRSGGCPVELGYALCRKKFTGNPYIIVSGANASSCIFTGSGFVDVREPLHMIGQTRVVERALKGAA